MYSGKGTKMKFAISWYLFYKYRKRRNIYIQGSIQDFYWKKGTHESIDVVFPHFNVEINKCDNICPIY